MPKMIILPSHITFTYQKFWEKLSTMKINRLALPTSTSVLRHNCGPTVLGLNVCLLPPPPTCHVWDPYLHPYNVGSVLWRLFSTLEVVQYIGGCSVHRGDNISTVGG